MTVLPELDYLLITSNECRESAGLHHHSDGGLHQEHGGRCLPARLEGRSEVLRMATLPGAVFLSFVNTKISIFLLSA
jgi:hypothetical protein